MSHSAVFFLLVIAPILAIVLAWLGWLTIPTNPVGWFLLFVGVAFSVGLAIAYLVRRGQIWNADEGKIYTNEEKGDRSFWLITLGMIALFYLSPLEYLIFGIAGSITIWKKLAGFGMILFGTLLFIWARRTLGAGYSGHASITEDQILVQTGPYRIIRHPAYLGYLLMALGVALGYWSLAGILSVILLILPSVIYRSGVEERMLAAHFGKEYQLFAKKTKRLIPGIW